MFLKILPECGQGQEDLCEDFFAYNRAKGTLYDGETRERFPESVLIRECIKLKNKHLTLNKRLEVMYIRFVCNNKYMLFMLIAKANYTAGKPVYMYSMGGLAEYCVVPANALAALPNTVPYTESAILGCAVFTAYGAMKHAADVRVGDSVAVIGIGGVGSSCLQIARAFGATEIIAVDVQDEKLNNARILGATHTINAAKDNAVDKIKEITGGSGVDVAVEALGKPLTFLQCTQSVKDGGKAVMIGIAASNSLGEVDITRLVRRQIKIIGSYGGRARQDLPQVVKLAEREIFNLHATVSRKCRLEEADKAYQDLDAGKIVGRAVVEIMLNEEMKEIIKALQSQDEGL
ncbi:hypothetical protein ACLOJK_017017 [Asimina triloba]